MNYRICFKSILLNLCCSFSKHANNSRCMYYTNGRRIVFPKDFADIAAFTTTCDWCVYNRIFVSRMAEWGEMEEGVLDMSTYYYEANPASVLLDYINAARQTWNYG